MSSCSGDQELVKSLALQFQDRVKELQAQGKEVVKLTPCFGKKKNVVGPHGSRRLNGMALTERCFGATQATTLGTRTQYPSSLVARPKKSTIVLFSAQGARRPMY